MVHPPMESKRSHELDVIVGTAKEAANIPLPPSLSLNSTIYSIKTEYYNGGSDLRDETHEVDTVDSMRDSAEVMTELPHCKSMMSIKTEYLKPPRPHRNQRTNATSDVAAIKEIVMDSPEIVNSMSMGSIKASNSKLSHAASEEEVEVALSRSCSTQNLKPLIMTHSRSSLSSKLSNKSGVTSGEQSPRTLPNNMSLSSQKSSKKGGEASIPLALTKSRSSQKSIKSSSSQQEILVPNPSTLSLSRSRSTASKLSVRTEMINVPSTPSETGTHKLPLETTNSMSSISRKSSKGGDSARIPLSLPKSLSNLSRKSTTSKQAEMAVVKSGSGSDMSIPNTRSNDSTKSASNQAGAAETPLSASQLGNTAGSITQSRSNSSNLSISRSASKNEKVAIETQPQSEPDLIPSNTSSSMRTISLKTSKDDDAIDIQPTLPPSSSNQFTSSKKETENPKSVDTVITTSSKDHLSNVMSATSPMVYTALDGNILWKIMNQEMDYDLDDESSVNKTEESNIFTEIEKKLSRDRILDANSTLTEATGNTTSHLRKEEVWDNSIEVSYSDLGNFLKEINAEAAAEDSNFILSPNCPTSPRRKAKWLKLRKIIAGKSGHIQSALLEKKMKSKKMLKRLSKKKLREDKQSEEIKAVDTPMDKSGKNEKPNEEGNCGEFGWDVQYDSIEKSFKNIDIDKVDEEEKRLRLNEEMATPSQVEPSSLPWNTPDVLDNNVFCSKLAWDEAICNFQEAKAAIFGLTGNWMAEKEEPVPEEVRLDEEKANKIIAASKELYRQRELLRVKAADLEMQQNVARHKRNKEKIRHLVMELPHVKRAEGESFALFKDLFTSLSSKERKLAIKLGDDVARAAKELRSLQCDAVVEIETSLPADWGKK